MKIRFELRWQNAGDLESATGPGSIIAEVSGQAIREHFGSDQKRNFNSYTEARAWLIDSFERVATFVPYTPSPLPRFIQNDEMGFVEITL